MQKTIVVELEDRKSHPLYGKIIRTTSKVKAHDENGDAGIGDRVRLMETRPTSATKRWRLVEVLEKAGSLPAGAPPREPRIRGVWLLHDDDLGPASDWEAGRGFSSNPRSQKGGSDVFGNHSRVRGTLRNSNRQDLRWNG